MATAAPAFRSKRPPKMGRDVEMPWISKPRMGSRQIRGSVRAPSAPSAPSTPLTPTKIPGPPPLTLKAKKSPDMEKAKLEHERRKAELREGRDRIDQNLRFHIDEYKKRLGEGPTTRAIERSASAIRDNLAGQLFSADVAGAATGRGRGFGAGGLAESAQRAQAGAAAGISLGRERDLDRLVLGGGGIMGAPGQREMGYEALLGQEMGRDPYGAAARFGLSEKDLGLRSYLGQMGAQTDRMRAQADAFGRPIDWFNALYSGGGMF